MTVQSPLESPSIAAEALDATGRSRPGSRKALWAGRIISAVPVLLLLLSAVMKFLLPPGAVEGFEQLGWPERLALGLGIVEVGVVVCYLVPQTTVLGAILITGYLGGAIATHVRIGDQFIIPLLLGVLTWLGLYLREPRLRALLPWRR